MGPEKKFENRVKKWLDGLMDTWYFKVHGSAVQKSGVPDIVASINGLFVGLEIKSDEGRLSELQKATLYRMRRKGALVFVVCPSNFDKISRQLEELAEMDFEDVPFDTEELYVLNDENLNAWGIYYV